MQQRNPPLEQWRMFCAFEPAPRSAMFGGIGTPQPFIDKIAKSLVVRSSSKRAAASAFASSSKPQKYERFEFLNARSHTRIEAHCIFLRDVIAPLVPGNVPLIIQHFHYPSVAHAIATMSAATTRGTAAQKKMPTTHTVDVIREHPTLVNEGAGHVTDSLGHIIHHHLLASSGGEKTMPLAHRRRIVFQIAQIMHAFHSSGSCLGFSVSDPDLVQPSFVVHTIHRSSSEPHSYEHANVIWDNCWDVPMPMERTLAGTRSRPEQMAVSLPPEFSGVPMAEHGLVFQQRGDAFRLGTLMKQLLPVDDCAQLGVSHLLESDPNKRWTIQEAVQTMTRVFPSQFAAAQAPAPAPTTTRRSSSSAAEAAAAAASSSSSSSSSSSRHRRPHPALQKIPLLNRLFKFCVDARTGDRVFSRGLELAAVSSVWREAFVDYSASLFRVALWRAHPNIAALSVTVDVLSAAVRCGASWLFKIALSQVNDFAVLSSCDDDDDDDDDAEQHQEEQRTRWRKNREGMISTAIKNSVRRATIVQDVASWVCLVDVAELPSSFCALDVRRIIETTDVADGSSPLTYSLRSSDKRSMDLVKGLLKKIMVSPDKKDASGVSPLKATVIHGNVKGFELILRACGGGMKSLEGKEVEELRQIALLNQYEGFKRWF